MENFLKKTSIRARFAIGLTCVKKLFRNEDLQGDLTFRLIAEKYAAFTDCHKFDIWECEIEHYGAGIYGEKRSVHKRFSTGNEIVNSLVKINKQYAEHNRPGNHSTWYVGVQLPIYDEKVYDDLLRFYTNLNSELIKALSLCERIASAEFYTSVTGFSESTLTPALKLLQQSGADFDFEEIARRYPFSEDKGWGRSFQFGQFMK